MISLMRTKQRLSRSSTSPAGCAAESDVKPRRSASRIVTSCVRLPPCFHVPASCPSALVSTFSTRVVARGASGAPVSWVTMSWIWRSVSWTTGSFISLIFYSKSGFLGISLVEDPLEVRMHAAQPVDDLLRPVEILAAPAHRPVRRGRGGHVAHVGDLVGELHELRLAREVRRVLDLGALPLGL